MPHPDSLESSTSVQSNRCRILRFRGNPRIGYWGAIQLTFFSAQYQAQNLAQVIFGVLRHI